MESRKEMFPHPCPCRLVHTGHRSEEHTSELQSQSNLVCRLLLEKKKNNTTLLPLPAVPRHLDIALRLVHPITRPAAARTYQVDVIAHVLCSTATYSHLAPNSILI